MPKPPRKQHKPSRGPAGQSAAWGHLSTVLQHAQSLTAEGQIGPAIELLEANQGRLSQFAPFRAALASLYGEVGRHREAAVQARLALDQDPRHADYYLLAAMAYHAAGYYTFAHRARQEWLRATPSGPLLADEADGDGGGVMRRRSTAGTAGGEAGGAFGRHRF